MTKIEGLTRRDFIQKASVLGAGGLIAPAVLQAGNNFNDKNEGDNFIFLFQGDSITDGNRSRNMDWNHVLGHGYAYLIAARLWYKYPKKGFQFFNRGISGNTVDDLLKRWNEDTITLKPNILSILIGVNDTLKAVNGDNEATVERFEKDYRELLIQTQNQLPGATLVICEPFILPVGSVKEKWVDFEREIIPRQAIVKNIALEYNAIFIPLQKEFNKAAIAFPPNNFWLWDGVHPMPNGHELFARIWIKHVAEKLRFIK